MAVSRFPLDPFVVQKHQRATTERIEKFVSNTYFTDVNLRGRLYPQSVPLESLKAVSSLQAITPKNIAQKVEKASAVNVGYSFGPTWSTHWFQCQARIPPDWKGKEIRFRWNSGCEAMVWINGEALQGLTGGDSQHRYDFVLTDCAVGGECYTLNLEVAANGICGAGEKGLINPPNPNQYYSVALAEVAVFDRDVYNLLMDLNVMLGVIQSLKEDDHRRFETLYAANAIVNSCRDFSQSELQMLHKQAQHFLNQKNGDMQFTLYAFGHCHIDSAWLWPYSETIRKCARSWSSQLRLMEKYPQFTFACSQAQQFCWVKEHYPTLYGTIKERVQTGQFLPLGGAWVEMDGNLPSGESFVRQFLYGQQFFQEEFGAISPIFWLPDTFGYSAQLPQIAVKSGMKYFLSQKLSWSLTNTFPHTSFFWEGLDGTRVLAHFPPADTYNSDGSVQDVLKSVQQFKDKGRSRSAVLLFGHGDGGGGPTEDMIESLTRMKDFDSLPKVVQSKTPLDFFSELEAKDAHNLCTWKGELYLELHRGTYTSQAKLKKMNRLLEFQFHDAEFLQCAMALLCGITAEVTEASSLLKSLWPKMLLNQFHDVLPGSSIEMVNVEVMRIYQEVFILEVQLLCNGGPLPCTRLLPSEILPQLQRLVWTFADSLAQKLFSTSESEASMYVLNTFPWERLEVVEFTQIVAEGEEPKEKRQKCFEHQALIHAAPLGFGEITSVHDFEPVKVAKVDGLFHLENLHLSVKVNSSGNIVSLVHKGSGRDAMSPGGMGNLFVLYDDVPLFWDAWDVMEYHLETRKPLIGCDVSVLLSSPLQAVLSVAVTISNSSWIQQRITLDAESPFLKFDNQVEWREAHKLLKVEFPWNVQSTEATYEIQFGHLKRPNHFNTSWDQAKFEVCGHKWADLSEHGFGVSLINNSVYGHSTFENVMSLSLLRSPKAPDANADMGQHHISFAAMPHAGTFQESGVVQAAYNFNNPLLIRPIPHGAKSASVSEGPSRLLFKVSNPGVILETVKLAECGMNAIVLRLYEAYGSHSSALVESPVPFESAGRCNLLEIMEEPFKKWTGSVRIDLKPFEIYCLKLCF